MPTVFRVHLVAHMFNYRLRAAIFSVYLRHNTDLSSRKGEGKCMPTKHMPTEQFLATLFNHMALTHKKFASGHDSLAGCTTYLDGCTTYYYGLGAPWPELALLPSEGPSNAH